MNNNLVYFQSILDDFGMILSKTKPTWWSSKMQVCTCLDTSSCLRSYLPLDFKKASTPPCSLKQNCVQRRSMKHTHVTRPHTRVSSIHGRAHNRIWFWNWTLKIKLIHHCLHNHVSGHVWSKKAYKTLHTKDLKRREQSGRTRERDTEKRKKRDKKIQGFSNRDCRELLN